MSATPASRSVDRHRSGRSAHGEPVAYSSARLRISVPEEAVADFCRRHHIQRLAVFGSALRDDFGPSSDVDVLVEFEPGHVPGFRFVDLQEELSRLFGRRVDLNTPNSLSRYFRARVLADARPIYAA